MRDIVGDRHRCGRTQRRLPALLRIPAPHHPGRRTRHHRVVGDLSAHDGTRRDHDVAAEPGPREDHRSGADPASGPDHHRLHARPLLADRLVGIVVTVVGGGDVDIRTAVGVRADRHRCVGDDMAPPAQHHTVAQGEDGFRSQIEIGHQAGRERHLLADDAVVAQLDPRLPEHGALREGQPGPRADTSEPEPPGVPRGDRPGLLHPGPDAVDGAGRDEAPPEGQGGEHVPVLRHPLTVVGPPGGVPRDRL